MCGKKGFICIRPMPESHSSGVSLLHLIGSVPTVPAAPPFIFRESPEHPAPDPNDPEPAIPSGTSNDNLPPDEEEVERGMHQAWLDWYERQPEEFRRWSRHLKERWVRYRLGLPLTDCRC